MNIQVHRGCTFYSGLLFYLLENPMQFVKTEMGEKVDSKFIDMLGGFIPMKMVLKGIVYDKYFFQISNYKLISLEIFNNACIGSLLLYLRSFCPKSPVKVPTDSLVVFNSPCITTYLLTVGHILHARKLWILNTRNHLSPNLVLFPDTSFLSVVTESLYFL